LIHNLNINDFLKKYWQKKPLLIRSAFENFQAPLSAEELAGLACEDFIESRIIIEHKSAPKWTLENGPFAETRFANLPETNWTLLIQGLNKIVPELDDLLHHFNFIPSWRVDDLMASYAAPGGSVGPHIDQYDVFLLQASGRRKWMISEKETSKDDLEPDLPLKILNNFEAEQEWILEAGDMLYLPPNVAHYGIGMDDCMTYSIGFRAPSHAELLTSYLDEHIAGLKDSLRYQDPDLTNQQNPGEISSIVIDQIQQIFTSHFNNKSVIADWFAHYITDYLTDDTELAEHQLSTEKFLTEFKLNNTIRRPATVRANYLVNDNHELVLYINGDKQTTTQNSNTLVQMYCNQHMFSYKDIKPLLNSMEASDFFCSLYNSGFLEF